MGEVTTFNRNTWHSNKKQGKSVQFKFYWIVRGTSAKEKISHSYDIFCKTTSKNIIPIRFCFIWLIKNKNVKFESFGGGAGITERLLHKKKFYWWRRIHEAKF